MQMTVWLQAKWSLLHCATQRIRNFKNEIQWRAITIVRWRMLANRRIEIEKVGEWKVEEEEKRRRGQGNGKWKGKSTQHTKHRQIPGNSLVIRCHYECVYVCVWVDSKTVMVLKGCKDNFPVPLKCFANDLNNSEKRESHWMSWIIMRFFGHTRNKQSVIIEGNIRQRYLCIRCVHVCSYVYYI